MVKNSKNIAFLAKFYRKMAVTSQFFKIFEKFFFSQIKHIKLHWKPPEVKLHLQLGSVQATLLIITHFNSRHKWTVYEYQSSLQQSCWRRTLREPSDSINTCDNSIYEGKLCAVTIWGVEWIFSIGSDINTRSARKWND